MIGMLLLTCSAFGEVVYDYDWAFNADGDGDVDKNDPPYSGSAEIKATFIAWDNYLCSWMVAQSSMEWTVTEGAYYEWDYNIESSCYVAAWREDSSPYSGYASTLTYASCPHSYGYAVTWAELDEDYDPNNPAPWDNGGSDNSSDNGTDTFKANESLYIDLYVYIEANITQDSDNEVDSYGWAKISGGLTYYEPL